MAADVKKILNRVRMMAKVGDELVKYNANPNMYGKEMKIISSHSWSGNKTKKPCEFTINLGKHYIGDLEEVLDPKLTIQMNKQKNKKKMTLIDLVDRIGEKSKYEDVELDVNIKPALDEPECGHAKCKEVYKQFRKLINEIQKVV